MQTLRITGMHCSHCADAVRNALLECAGVATARVDLAEGKAEIAGAEMNAAALQSAVESLGYKAESVETT